MSILGLYTDINILLRASLVAQTVKKKNTAAMLETCFLSLDWEEPLENKRLPTPVFLPGESHGQRSLLGYSPWGRIESDTTECLKHTHTHIHTRTPIFKP